MTEDQKPKPLVNVQAALNELRALIATVDERVATFAAQAQEAEASLAARARDEVAAARTAVEEMARQAAADAAANAIREVEATRASFDKRVAQIEETLSRVEEALAADIDGDGQIGTVTMSAQGGASQISAPIPVPSGGAPTPRLAELIEENQTLTRRVNDLERAALWAENFHRELCAAVGVKYEFIAGKADAREGRNAAAE